MRPSPRFKLLLGLLPVLVACSERPAQNAGVLSAPHNRGTALFTNGDFESDAIGATPPAGWTLLNYLNSSGVSGTASAPPSSFTALNLSGLGTAVNETFIVGGTAMSQTDPDLGAGQSFRYPAYGARAARINYKDAATYGKNKNANLLRQTMTIGLGDIDPVDGQVHVRFAVAPVLENPSHAYNQQPYFYVELLNVTRGTTLFTGFNVAGQTGVPWHTTTSLATGNATQWLDWQLVDIAPGNAALATGDQVKLTVVASGCALGGHFGRIYVDGIGATIPGPFVSATAPASVNAGATLVYSVRYSNGGSAAAIGARFDMVTPPNTTFASLSGLTGCTTPTAGQAGAIACSLGTLNPQASGAFTVTVNVAAGATGSIVNGNYSIGSVNSPTLLGAQVSTVVNSSTTHYADLVVTKIGGTAAAPVTSVQQSQVFSTGSPLYTLTVTNNSTTDQIRSSTGKSFTFTDVVPAAVTNVTWACTVTNAGAGTGTASKCRDAVSGTPYNGTGNSISLSPRLGYNNGSGGGQIQILVYGTISATATGSLVNTAVASAPSGVTDPNLTNNTATVTLPIGTPRTLSLTKAGGAANGTVSSAPAGVYCGTSCSSLSATFAQGAQVLLSAVPTGSASFTGWSGCTSTPTPTTCSVTIAATNAVTATFTAAPAPSAAAAVYVYGGGTQSTPASTAFPSSLQVLVTDAAGTPKSGVVVTYAAPGSGASCGLGTGTATTNAFGVASLTATANATAGTYAVNATVSGVATPATFKLTNVGAPASITYVNGGNATDPQLAPINTAFGAPLVAVVKDAAGSVVPFATVTYTVVPAGGASATLSSATDATDSSGLSSVTATANGTVGSYTVTATAPGVATPATFSLQNASTGPAAIFIVSGNPQTTGVGAAFTDPLVVAVADASGNSLPGITVTFATSTAASGAGATLSASTAVTNASGLARITATANGSGGAYTVSAAAAGVSTPVVFSLTNDGGYSIQVQAGSPQTATISTAFGTTLQALVLDGVGAAASGLTVTFQAPSSGATAALTGGAACTPPAAGCMTAVTNASGIATLTATANALSGSYDVTATTPLAPTNADFLLTNLCTSSAQCGGAAPICAASACVACASDAVCASKSSAAPYCDPSGACVACLTDSQCTGSAPICSQATASCAACSTDAQCANKNVATPYCTSGTGACSAGFTLTASASANGAISPSGALTVGPGATQAYSITPDANYRVSDVLVDGVSVGAVTSYSFSNVQASHTIAASFAPNTFALTPSAGANGSISPAGVQTVNYGGNQTFTITPAAGYHVLDVLVDGASVGAVTSYPFTNVQAAHTIAASFVFNTYSLTPSAGANGSISPAGVQTVNYGGNQTFTITPAAGYHVADVLVDGVSVGAVTSYPFTNVQAAHTIAASFAINTYSLTPSAGANGSISPAGVQTVNYGGNQTFTITPAAGYHVADVLVDGVSVGAVTSYPFTNVQAAHTIAASFAINTYSLTPSAGANGSISPAGVQTVNYGGNQTFTITPAAGYHVADVLVDGVSVGAVTSYPFTNVQAAHTIAASFAINTYSLTPSAGANGSISPAGVQTVNYGGNQTFTITPAAGYHVADVLVDGVSVGAVTSYPFTNVQAAHTIAASFAINTYSLTPSAGANGSISPAGVQTVNYGGNQTFTITPAAGYHVADVLVDGVSVGAVTSYPFTNVQAAHTIAASFAINTYSLTPSSGSNGSISPAGVQTVNYGGNQTFTITPAAGYHVADLLVDGVSVGAVTSYPFTNVQAAHTIAASFAINTYSLTPSAGANGSISPAGVQTVNYGGNQTFTITPATGYHVADVLVDGVSVGAVTSYPFTNVQAAHTIAASFAINTYPITVNPTVNGTVTCTSPVAHGQQATCTITPAAGYQLVTFTDGGADALAQVSGGQYVIDAVTAAHLIDATFLMSKATACAADNQCASGACADGRCCDRACDGQCEACDVAGNVGSCSPVPAEQLPHTGHASCTGTGSGCGGACDGATTASCAYPASGCAPPSCTDGRFTGIALCGLGVCGAPPASVSCGAYACDAAATACNSGCSVDGDCAAGNYCDGSTSPGQCKPKLDPAAGCTSNHQCGTGECVDGVCCNTACSGQCQACDVPGHAGTCTTVASGAPHGGRAACATDGSSCGGTCDGTAPAACGYPGASTTCRAASCSSGVEVVAAGCAGNGACPALVTHACASYACNAAGTACNTGCSVDGDCATGNYCDGSTNPGQCKPKLDPAAACTANHQCGTGQCVDGVCCNTACDGQCQACDVPGSVGTCAPVTGAPHASRAACASDGSSCGGACDGVRTSACSYPSDSVACRGASCASGVATLAAACDGAGACPAVQTQACSPYVCGSTACRGDCSADSDCISGDWCSAGVCVAKLPPGGSCSASTQCQGGHCVDGVCCDSACDGQCEACAESGHVGACTPVAGAPRRARPACASDGSECGGACDGTHARACAFPAGETRCRDASCANGTAVLTSMCNGAGACPAEQDVSCGAYVCGATACLGNCQVDRDCAAGDYCAAGVCTVKQGPGGACSGANQCGTGQCVDGVCCDTACDGQCQACDEHGHAGTCSTVSGAPRGARTACASDGSGCGGACDGASPASCTYPSAETSCRDASCRDGVAALAATCDGAGRCPPRLTQGCGAYLCGGDSCQGDCTTDANCTADSYCAGGVCAPRLTNGGACGAGNQCASGQCVDGVCCNTACDGQCQACDVPGHAGTCSPVPGGGAPHGARSACGSDGTACGGSCDGAATTACSYPGSSVVCHAASCSGGVVTEQSTCDGSGACPAPGQVSCQGQACSGAVCSTGCTSDAQCTESATCVAGVCQIKGTPGVWRVAGAGGCASGGAGTLGPACLFSLLAVLALRRRRLPAVARARARSRRGLAGLALSCALAPLAANAQATTPVNPQFNSNRFSPGAGSFDVLSVGAARAPEHLDLHLSLFFAYARDPLLLVATGANEQRTVLVRNQSLLHLGASIGLFDRFELGLVLPVAIVSGAGATDLLGPAITPGQGLGDLRVVPKAEIFRGDDVQLAIAAPFTLPTGSGAAFLSQGGLTFNPELRAESSALPVRVAASAGVILRDGRDFSNLSVGTALTYGLGADKPFTWEDQKFAAMATFAGEVGFSGGGVVERPMELLGALRWFLPAHLHFTVGGGPGITTGYGTPRFRVFAGFGYDPPVARERAPAPLRLVQSQPAPVAAQVAAEPPPPPPAPLVVAAPAQPAAPPPAPPELAAPPLPLPPPSDVRWVERNGNRALLAQVQFAHDRDVILASSLPVLDEVAKVLSDHPELEHVRIEGHTDGHGRPAYNRKLSQRRAESVLRYLVQVGIASARLEAKGFGADVPIAPNATESGRAQNRRVEFVPVEGPRPEKT